MGHWINWNSPQTFTEKIQWLKLYNRKPIYTTMVDKAAVKNYVAKIIGNQYIIPTLGCWDTVEDIDWDLLPNRFVLKTTHGGGGCGIVICKDKKNLDISAAKEKLNKSLAADSFYAYREWPYKNVSRRIIAEQLLECDALSSDIPDYKFFCFNGEPKYCQVIRDRSNNESIDFYDMDWQHQEFFGLNPIAKNGSTPVPKPKSLDEMKSICRRLSKGLPFVRVDLYVQHENVYFGELTFYPAAGLGTFTPDKYNRELSDLLLLSEHSMTAKGM